MPGTCPAGRIRYTLGEADPVCRTHAIYSNYEKMIMSLSNFLYILLAAISGSIFFVFWRTLQRQPELSRARQGALRWPLRLCAAAVGILAALFFQTNFASLWSSSQPAVTDFLNRPAQQGKSNLAGKILAANREILAQTIADTNQRKYPQDLSLYSHIIEGIEFAYNDALNGRYQTRQDDKNGFTVVTTIDPTYQKILKDALASAAPKIGVPIEQLKAAGVILDVSDEHAGAVLATVSLPDYPLGETQNKKTQPPDPVVYGSTEKLSPEFNRVLWGAYPPGSTFKIVTVSAALDLNLTSPDEVFDLMPYISPTDPTLHILKRSGVQVDDPNCFMTHRPNLMESFAYSCNSVFAMLAERIGPDQLLEYAKRFKFEKNIDLGQLYVAPGRLDSQYNPKSPGQTIPVAQRPISTTADLLFTGIGQGELLVTPLHMAMIAATIARNGEMPEPYMVSRIESADGSLALFQAQPRLDLVIQPKAARVVKKMMTAVVKYPYGSGFKILDFTGGDQAALKTGTAAWGNADNMPHSWVVGFWPVDHPQIAFAILVEQGGSGYKIAVPVAGQIISALPANQPSP